MMTKSAVAGTIFAILFTTAIMYWLFATPDIPETKIPDSLASIENGQYLVNAGGCVSCHQGISKPDSLSGGLALESPFGTFYVPNITPDKATGLGNWSGRDFLLALKYGRKPGGGFYYPAFPYTAYAGMLDQDVLDIAAYLKSLPTIQSARKIHETPFWLSQWMLAVWNKLAAWRLSQLPEIQDPGPDLTIVTRGSYLARHLGHCGECHTPRDILGIPIPTMEYAGATIAEYTVEAINANALKNWTEEDFTYFLYLGMKPNGEFVGGEMESVINHNTSQLTLEDQKAISAYFLSL
ncbi:MAG: cytochrome c [Pseudomonadales bacterium]|nr:cytochrome c [Pseudomonadales bacterium]